MWMERLENEPFLIIPWLAASASRRLLEAWRVVRGLRTRSKPPCLFVGGWNDAYSNAIPRLMKGLRITLQGDHRAVGAQISAFRRAGAAHRLPAGGAALVGLLAQGRAHRRHRAIPPIRVYIMDAQQARPRPATYGRAAGSAISSGAAGNTETKAMVSQRRRHRRQRRARKRR